MEGATRRIKIKATWLSPLILLFLSMLSNFPRILGTKKSARRIMGKAKIKYSLWDVPKVSAKSLDG